MAESEWRECTGCGTYEESGEHDADCAIGRIVGIFGDPPDDPATCAHKNEVMAMGLTFCARCWTRLLDSWDADGGRPGDGSPATYFEAWRRVWLPAGEASRG